MDKIAAGVSALIPNAINGLMFARRQQGPGVHPASDCCLTHLRIFLPVGMRQIEFAYLLHRSFHRLGTTAISAADQTAETWPVRVRSSKAS